MRSVRPPQVLICSAYDVLGLTRLPRVLKAAGCHVTFMGPTEALAGKSRYVDRVCTVSGSTAVVAEALKKHLDDLAEPYRLITVGDDRLLQELYRYRHAAWLRDWFPVDPEQPACDAVVSKAAFAGMAHKTGMPVPRFQLCCTFADAENAAGALGFPLVLKRITGSAGLDVRIVGAYDDLAGAYTDLKGSAPLLAQQYITGRIGSTDVLFNRGNPVCWYSSYSVVSLPAETGPSCVRELTLHPEIEPLLVATGDLTGFHGFGGIDWIQSSDTGRLSLIEFNARPTPGYHFGSRSGVDFSVCLAAMLRGTTCIHKPVSPLPRNAFLYLFPQDVLLAVHNKNLLHFLRWLLPGRRSGDIPFDDPRVLYCCAVRIFVKIAGDVRDAFKRLLQRAHIRRFPCSA